MSKEGIIDMFIHMLTDKEFRDKAVDELFQNRFDFLNHFDISSKELEGLKQFIQDIPDYLIKIVSKNLSTISMTAANNFGDMFQSVMSGLNEMGGMEGLFRAFGGPSAHSYDDDDEDEIIITYPDEDEDEETEEE